MNARIVLCALLVACGGSAKQTNAPAPDEPKATQEELNAAVKPCGEKDKIHKFELHDEKADEALSPCSEHQAGGHDYSGLIKMESVEHGVRVIIDARDDEVTLLGPDAKSRDAVIVYPKGPNGKPEGIEVPLVKTKTGYHGDKIILWEHMDKLTDEGTQLHVAIFDHDKTGTHEELHVAVNVSTGKSCEKAIDENPQKIDMGKKGGKDLTDAQLGAPLRDSTFMTPCNLPDSSSADICVAVKNGTPLGVSVGVKPSNNKIAACIDRAVRRMKFPSSEKLDVVHQKFD